MKKIVEKLMTLIILLVLISYPIVPSFANIDELGKKDNYIITSDEKTINDLQEKYGGEVSDDGKILSDVELTERQINKIEDETTTVGEDIILSADLDDEGTQSVSENFQWNLEALNVKDIEKSEQKVKIAIIDSGISFSDDFTITESKNFIENDGNENPLFDDSTGHGTAMAGIIAAYDNGYGIKGINPNAELYSAKVLDSTNKAPLSRIIEGIYWSIDNHVDVINMSFGTTVDSEVLHNAIKLAYNSGIILVASSGNTANGIVKYPAKYDEVIGVGALGVDSNVWKDTSKGEGLDLVAPGQKIETTGVLAGILSTCGTSISAAQVSGVASLLLERDKTKSPDFIKNLLISTSKEITYEDRKVGLVDYNYASEFYDEFAKNYSQNKQTEIPLNNSEIANYTEETNGIVEGMWGNGTNKNGHYNMSKDAADAITNPDLTTYYTNLIIYACTNVDNYYGSATGKDPGKTCSNVGHKVQALHGRGNYVANIRFISNFAQYMGQGLSKSSAISKCEAKFPNLITYNSSQGKYVDATKPRMQGESSGESDGAIMMDLVEALEEMYDHLTKPGSKITLYKDQAESNQNEGTVSISIGPKRRMLVFLGVALHTMGDVYSHRTMVPSYVNFNDEKILKNTNHADQFYTNDFNSTSATISNSLKTNLKKYVYWMDPFHNDNNSYRYKEYLEYTIKAGVVEFQDVIRFEKSNSFTKYDDNASFCKERYNDALKCCKKYLSDIIVANYPNFTGVKKFYVKYLFPSDDYVKLNNFKNYAIDAGLNTDSYSASNWTKHSTSNYV